MLRIAATGGTGFIGSHLVERLASEGHSVRALVRKTSNTYLLDGLGAELVIGDVTDRESLSELVEDADVVYHLAACVYWGSEEDYWNVNYRGVKNVLDACVQMDLERFVFTSTITVTGNVTNPPADETHPYNPRSSYERAKCEAEKLVLEYHQRFSMPNTVVRPAVVYGPRNMHQLKICQWLKTCSLFIGEMRNSVHLSYIDNLIDGLVLAASKPEAIGQVYIIADEAPTPWREYFRLIAEALGVDPPERHVPLWMVRAAARLFEVQSRIFGTEPLVARFWVEEITKNLAYDISKARTELGYNPTVPLREGIRRTLEWYKENDFIS